MTLGRLLLLSGSAALAVAPALAGASLATLLLRGPQAAEPAAPTKSWTFRDGMPAEAAVTGDAVLAPAPDGSGQCLRVGRNAEVSLPVAAQNGHGSVRIKVLESGFARQGDGARAYGYGPLWGLSNGGGDRFVVGVIWAPFLEGNANHAWVSTAQNGWFNRWSAGLRRQPGWHTWEIAAGADATVRVLMDGKEAPSVDPAGTAFGQGFNGVYLRGARDVDDPLYVASVEVAYAAGAPKRVLKPFPRTDWPLPATHPARPDAAWTRGYPRDPSFFPVAVWLQDPKHAARYKEAGFNLYVGLWKGPTEEQLAALRAAGMRVICDQNAVGLVHIDDGTIVAWMHGDEPDNAQPLYDEAGKQKGWGGPVPPPRIVESYRKIKQADPSRPVLLNLGQGISNEKWRGRGTGARPEDYDTYVQGADIVSFDVYPIADTDIPAGDRYLWLVPKGVDRLRALTGNKKVVWNALECTRISNTQTKPTPAQVRTEAWMSIIHGSTGLIWFVHQFAPAFREAALFDDPAMLAEVSAINRRVQELAPVLNSPTRSDLASVTSDPESVPVDILVKQSGGATYLFAVAMQDEPTQARFAVKGLPAKCAAEVLGENRTLPVKEGVFEDGLAGSAVHLYRITSR